MRISFLLVAALLSQAAYAQLLSVDFDDNTPVTETAFSSFAEGDKPSKVFGAYTVTVTGEQAAVVGGFFDRGLPPDAGAMTYGELYRDFVFHNSSGTLSVTIDGVTPNTPYIITWYLFDSAAIGNVANRLQARGGSNTTGSSVDVSYTSGSGITSNSQFSWSGAGSPLTVVWKSTSSTWQEATPASVALR